MNPSLIVARPPQGIRERVTVYLLHKAIKAHALLHVSRKPWGLKAEDLIAYPDNSLGKALGEFLSKENIEPIPKLERHDVFHVLLDYDTHMKDEAGLYFFLFGNGKKTFFAIGTILFAACMFPEHWMYLYAQYKRGQQAFPIIKLQCKELLPHNFGDVKKAVFREKIENIELLNTLCKSV